MPEPVWSTSVCLRFVQHLSTVDRLHSVTSPTEDATLGAFLERYPPRAYVRRNPGGSDYPGAELAPVTSADGLLHLAGVPTSVPKGSPPTRTGDGTNCHLWVIDERGRLCISEAPLQRLGPGKLHHTNLTGGGKASIGGELWFAGKSRVYLSGGSGRYPPASAEHLEDAAGLFGAVGFEVLSLGWDTEVDRPQRLLREQ